MEYLLCFGTRAYFTKFATTMYSTRHGNYSNKKKFKMKKYKAGVVFGEELETLLKDAKAK